MQKRLGRRLGLAPQKVARDKAHVSRRALVLVVTLCAACAARTPRLLYAGSLDDFLAAHRLSDGQNIRAAEIGRTASASYHVVQVRGAESPHWHVAHDLTVVVLRGHGTLTRDAERVALDAGDTAVVARGAPHWFANGARAPAVALVVFAPPLDAPDTVPVAARCLVRQPRIGKFDGGRSDHAIRDSRGRSAALAGHGGPRGRHGER